MPSNPTGSGFTGTGPGYNPGSAGSSFLTGPVGYGLGAAAGNLAGQAFGSNAVNFRGKYARNQLAHQRKVWQAERDQIRPNQRELMKSMDDSGLHRLAALGITPGAGGSSAPSQPMIPGQNPDFGSAIGQGIDTAIQMSSHGHQKTIAGLQVEEQSLRNDWLRSQIKNSEMARMKDIANMQRPPIPLTGHDSEKKSREYYSADTKPINSGAGTQASQLEEEINDWAQWMPSILTRAWDMFKQDFRNINDIPQQGLGPDWLRNPPKTPESSWWKNTTKPHQSIRY